jgi:hypothetical protein
MIALRPAAHRRPGKPSGSSVSCRGTAQASGCRAPELDRVLFGANQVEARAKAALLAIKIIVIRQRHRLAQGSGPAARSMAKKRSGWAMPANADSGGPPAAQQGPGWPSARTASAPVAGWRASPANAGWSPACSTAGPPRAARASRSGPAGSSQPLPVPRSSNTQISMSRCQRQVLQPVVAQDDLRCRGRALSRCRAASTRERPTNTGACTGGTA